MEKYNKWKAVVNTVDMNPTIPLTTLNVNGLNISIKRNYFYPLGMDKKMKPHSMLFIRNLF